MNDNSPPENGFTDQAPGPIEKKFPVAAIVKLIGGKYKTLILWSLLNETMRFSQLSRVIPCSTPKMLTQQLRELEASGLIKREVFPEVPPRVEYSLTEQGYSIKPVLEAMHEWGRLYLHLQDTSEHS